MIDATHDPKLRSWVESANRPGCDFPIQNLPLGVFRPQADTRLVGADRRFTSWMYDEAPAGSAFPSAAGAALARYAFLEWGECTDGVTAFAFPDGDQVHLACRLREEGGVTRGAEARHEPTVVSVSRAGLVDTLERGLAVAEREWAARRLTR